ncbi:MAG: hypothetical protein U1E35_04715 [Rhodospirillales bacterium]
MIDSPLSEASVLGFEYGYSLVSRNALKIIWEAQFGDFANGAQVIIDQFITPEIEVAAALGLVMLLPHGYEARGRSIPRRGVRALPATLRRGQYLQVLQLHVAGQLLPRTAPADPRNFRKPLVVFSPKSLLRHKMAVSSLTELAPVPASRGCCQEIDPLVPDAKVRRIVFCSGEVYDLLQERRNRGLDDQRRPRRAALPMAAAAGDRAVHPLLSAEVVWCREEPANMGAWAFVLPRLINILEELHRPALPAYVGRAAAASPATGLLKVHQAEQAQLAERALAGPLAELPQPFRRVVR